MSLTNRLLLLAYLSPSTSHPAFSYISPLSLQSFLQTTAPSLHWHLRRLHISLNPPLKLKYESHSNICYYFLILRSVIHTGCIKCTPTTLREARRTEWDLLKTTIIKLQVYLRSRILYIEDVLQWHVNSQCNNVKFVYRLWCTWWLNDVLILGKYTQEK